VYSNVVNFDFRKVVLLDPNPSTNITSAVSGTYLLGSMISRVILTYSVNTGSWVLWVIFSFESSDVGSKYVVSSCYAVRGYRAILDEVGMYHVLEIRW
jgi:hypothetical protein